MSLERGEFQRQMQMWEECHVKWRQRSGWNEGRDQAKAKKHIPSNPPETEEKAWNRFCLIALRRNQPCKCLYLGCLDGKTVRQLWICYLSYPICGTFCSSPRKLIRWPNRLRSVCKKDSIIVWTDKSSFTRVRNSRVRINS